MNENIFPKHYKIVVKGYLNEQWAHWFGGLSIGFTTSGETELSGQIADQAALYGVLNRLRDLGMTLILVTCIENGTDNKILGNRIGLKEENDDLL